MAVNRRLLTLLTSVTLVLLPLPAAPVTAGVTERAATTARPVPGEPHPRTPADIVGSERRTPRPTDQPPQQPPNPGSLCRPGIPPNAPPTTTYYEDNPLLGPARLPAANPVAPLLAGYQRFGALTEQEFLNQYANAAQDAYVYPPADGFVIGPDGRPVRTAQTLLPGYRLDRFGFPGGAYLAPLGTPFSSRSLPPTNLNTPANAPLANYHVYCVLKPFTVDAGPIAPWFAQPGMGTQYKLERRHLPDAGSQLSITWLVQNGYLVEEDLSTTAHGPCGNQPGVTVC